MAGVRYMPATFLGSTMVGIIGPTGEASRKPMSGYGAVARRRWRFLDEAGTGVEILIARP